MTWTNFLRSKEAQEIIERDPPAYSEGGNDDEDHDHPIIDPLQMLPRVEINNMWQEFRDVFNNEVRAQETEYNPWASSTDFSLSKGPDPV